MRAAEDKRSRLIHAAAQLVYEHGFNRTSLADIAAAAQVPLGNVYYYFKTKEDLGRSLIEQRSAETQALREECDRVADPRERLLAFLGAALRGRKNLARHGCPMGTLVAELQKEGGPLAKQAAGLLADHLRWLEAQFRALGHGSRARGLAEHLLSSFQGAVLLSHSFETPAYLERETRRLAEWIEGL